MSWSYNETDLSTSSASGRLNSVRLLVGDTDENDQLVQDEEITFALAQAGNNVYFAASWCANTISAKFSRRVDTKLDGALSANYSDLAKQFRALSESLREQGNKYSNAFSIVAGGISKAKVKANRQLSDRMKGAFYRGQHDNPPADEQYIEDYD